MKKLLLGLLVAGAAVTSLSTAEAAGGCGPGFHRGYYGACRPNFGPRRGPPVIGAFYPGQGYWSGGHYWGHRRWYGHGWRYY
jgi:hypothetical protein